MADSFENLPSPRTNYHSKLGMSVHPVVCCPNQPSEQTKEAKNYEKKRVGRLTLPPPETLVIPFFFQSSGDYENEPVGRSTLPALETRFRSVDVEFLDDAEIVTESEPVGRLTLPPKVIKILYVGYIDFDIF